MEKLNLQVMITITKSKLKVFLTKLMSVTLILAAFIGAISCNEGDDDDPTPEQQNVLELIVSNADFDVLEAAALRAGSSITNLLGGTTQITVFAPNDTAFIEYLNVDNEGVAISTINNLTPGEAADLLTFHVIVGSEMKASTIATGTTAVTTARSSNNRAFVSATGSGVTINNGKVITPDVYASNGVLHIIDAVLTPPLGDIVVVATSPVNAANFNILVASLTEADLISTLQSEGPFTVFAPTDDAFLTLLRSTAFFNNPNLTEAQALDYISSITAESTPLSLTTLKQVLLYHVVSGCTYSINLSDNQSLTTLIADIPKALTVDKSTAFKIEGNTSGLSTVTAANVSTTNGVGHAINKVLLP